MQPNRYTEIYAPLREQAADLQNKFHDFNAGKLEHPQAHAIHHEIRQLVQDIDLKKDPKAIEHRIKAVQTQLKQSQHLAQPIMDYTHYDYMHENFGNMLKEVQKIDHTV